MRVWNEGDARRKLVTMAKKRDIRKGCGCGFYGSGDDTDASQLTAARGGSALASTADSGDLPAVVAAPGSGPTSDRSSSASSSSQVQPLKDGSDWREAAEHALPPT